MKNLSVFFSWFFFFTVIFISSTLRTLYADTIPPRHKVTLSEAHVGDLKIDTRLLESYEPVPENIREFYVRSRSVFSETPDADFTREDIIKTAQENNLLLMGGPMLGKLSNDGVVVWLRPSTSNKITVNVSKPDGSFEKSHIKNSVEPGVEQRIAIDGLVPGTEYKYAVLINKQRIAEGGFTTAPSPGEKGKFRLAFGSCFHKIGIHNANLTDQILKRKPDVMMLLGDIAVDDRENNVGMHRADYLLRDVSQPWQKLSANVPLYASWDDHDYLNNDLSGIPKKFTESDRTALRKLWYQNWNNPDNESPGISFNTRIGPVEIIMLDTRSCRENERRGQYGSYLGTEQLNWLKETLKNSAAPFKVISSGTMWNDYISNGKDSWGTWDIEAREELFRFIETENISGVLLTSGDRHGARGFTIPRPSGFAFYEFEAASLGGVPGPEAMAKNSEFQLFGYSGTSIVAFGEFTFNATDEQPVVIFRLIDESGNILEEHSIPYSKLIPPKN